MARKRNESAVTDEQIIAALLSNGNMQAAAEACGLSPRTLYSRMGYRDFKALYSAARADMIRQAVWNMNRRLSEATDTIFEIMQDRNAPAGTRLAAARVIIDNAAKFSDRLAEMDEYTGRKANSTIEAELFDF